MNMAIRNKIIIPEVLCLSYEIRYNSTYNLQTMIHTCANFEKKLPVLPEACVFQDADVVGRAMPLHDTVLSSELDPLLPNDIAVAVDDAPTPFKVHARPSELGQVTIDTGKQGLATPFILNAPTTSEVSMADFVSRFKSTFTHLIDRISNILGDMGFDTTTNESISDTNPQGSQMSANLTGPLQSIDWGWEVADQTPDTDTLDIRVYFQPSGGTVSDDYVSEATYGWSSNERASAIAAFDQFEAVANVNFTYVTDIDDADFIMVEYRDTGIDAFLGFFGLSDSIIYVDGAAVAVNGYGMFNNAGPGWDTAGLTPGGYGYLTLIHEIGHGMGLAHPHDSGGSSSVMLGVTTNFGSTGTAGLNQGVYTVMTYNDGWLDGPDGVSPSYDYGYANGLLALDIAVLQDTYGANTTTRIGNDTYTLFGQNGVSTGYQAIWDAGGTDTISYSGSRDAVINLTAATLDYSNTGGGVVSYADGIFGGLTIAIGVVIENATGGSGDDWLTGNDADNVLNGNAGDDSIQGLGGTDSFFGGAGADRFIFIAAGGDIGTNTIQDFEDNIDSIEFSFPVQTAVQQGANVLFDFSDGNTVLVLNITTDAISDDVLFI